MSKPKLVEPPAPLVRDLPTINVTAKTMQYLDDLVATGLFGFNRGDAAERLICRGIQDMIATGELDER